MMKKLAFSVVFALGCAGTNTSPDAATVSCGTMTCAAAEVCVLTRTSGGPEPADGGSPAVTTSYACAARPSSCAAGAALTCDCASSLCSPSGGTTGTCSAASGSTVECMVFAP